MLSINTNISSLITQRSIKDSTEILNTAIERMTTGYKINHAKDNAANYSISTNMTTKIGALQVAEENAMQGLEMMSTTSENLSLIEDKLTRMRALAVQAQNGTYGTHSLSAISAEATALLDEINRINDSATYNGIKLFNTGKAEVTNAGKELELNGHGFLQDVVKVDTTGMTALSEMDDEATLAVGKYTISSVEELVQLKEMSDAGLLEAGSTFVLTRDIDMKGITDWTGVGATNVFRGVFDGNGHTISNLTGVNGLFACINRKSDTERWSEVKNVRLENVKIVSTSNSRGAICGDAQNVFITNCSVDGTVQGRNNVGGVIGYGYYASQTDSLYFNGNVLGVNNVGGIIGFVNTGTEPSNCYAFSNVQGEKSVGGILGYGACNNSKFLGSVSGESNIGGIAGIGSVKACYFAGTVNGDIGVGGIAGNSSHNWSIKIVDCIMEGEIQGNESIGIFMGANQHGGICPITNCYYYGKNVSNLEIAGAMDTATITNVADITIPCDYTLQVGSTGDSEASTVSCTTYIEFSGLKDVLSSGIESADSIRKIDDLLNIVSLKQTELGMMEQRLYSVLDEISTQYENLVSSHSTIRDADIAEESSAYIRGQILQQAAATLMSTANQNPMIALQLL